MDQKPGSRLRALLASERLLVAPGVFDGVSANLVNRMGFDCAYMTGGGVAASGFGLPDLGLVTASEMADRAATLANVLGDTPMIADADTGYGGSINVARTVRTYERAGVAAIQLEDQAFPKRCGHLPDKGLITEDEFIGKLGAALDARSDSLIIARTDARAVLGLDAALERAINYADAGADMVFVEAPETTDELATIAKSIDAPLIFNLVRTGATPIITHDELQSLGYSMAIHPADALFSAARAMIDSYVELGGTPPTTTSSGVAQFFDLIGLDDWMAVDEKWSRF